MIRVHAVALVAAALFGAGPAIACTLMPPKPESDLRHLRWLREEADSIFLARAVPGEGFDSALTPVVRLEGRSPPRRSTAIGNENCGDPPPEGVVVVFAVRMGPASVGWRFWKWGRWVVVGYRRPDEVVDPQLAAIMRRAADSLERARG